MPTVPSSRGGANCTDAGWVWICQEWSHSYALQASRPGMKVKNVANFQAAFLVDVQGLDTNLAFPLQLS